VTDLTDERTGDARAAAPSARDAQREAAIERALGVLDLEAKSRVLAGKDMWSLPALPDIGLHSVVMSDGPIGVRGIRWSPDDPSIALPSPTALAATWDPALAQKAGRLLGQESHRKGVHVLLAPTVNLHRSPLGGRHFEAYSEDPYLTGQIGAAYVIGVQETGVGTTVKHFVANEAETERFTVNNVVDERTLRELYLAPFEYIVKNAHPWGIMAAYNSVNGITMTEQGDLQNGILRGEWGFDGFIVSDWLAARDTVRAIVGGLDVAMPGPTHVFGDSLVAAVRAGMVDESLVDGAVRNVLRLAARVGLLDGAPPAVAPDEAPAKVDGDSLSREIASRSFVLARNERCGGTTAALPLDVLSTPHIALIGQAARDARVMGGGSAQVSASHIVSPLDGLTAALPQGAKLEFAVGADANTELSIAASGFDLVAVILDSHGSVLGTSPVPSGVIEWVDTDLPDGVAWESVFSVELQGTFTPRESGDHRFGTRGIGGFTLTVNRELLFDGIETPAVNADVFEGFFGAPATRGHVTLKTGVTVPVSLIYRVPKTEDTGFRTISFALMHSEPERDSDELIAEAAATARRADAAIVIVATTERVESEGFDRQTLRLPGRQDDLVFAVAAANPRTIVVVNSGSPVELPWRDRVAAILLAWFPGQEAGAALADVLFGAVEPGGRLPTTWPVKLDDAPVTRVTPFDDIVEYEEGVFIGYRAWERSGIKPAFPFGHGLGYTDWSYEGASFEPGTGEDLGEVRVTVRNIGSRLGREVVQLYLVGPEGGTADARPTRQLAGFQSITAQPGEVRNIAITVPRRAAERWDQVTQDWDVVQGSYIIEVSHSIDDPRLAVPINVAATASSASLVTDMAVS
jgi:beta-glucosidase